MYNLSLKTGQAASPLFPRSWFCHASVLAENKIASLILMKEEVSWFFKTKQNKTKKDWPCVNIFKLLPYLWFSSVEGKSLKVNKM